MGNAQVVALLLLLRVVVGLTMIAHGTNHWRGGGRIEGTARWFSGLGLRYGRLQAWMSVVTEIGAGALLVLGLFTPLACAAVISVMLIAGVLAHRPNGFFVFKDGYEYVLVLSVVSLRAAMSASAVIPKRLVIHPAVRRSWKFRATRKRWWAIAPRMFRLARIFRVNLAPSAFRPSAERATAAQAARSSGSVSRIARMRSQS
jgi:uncharacterized membrane protein YphA (DoxX/SURF4 family)